MNTFTQTTNQSWFSRLGSSFSGILIGLGLILAAAILLFWNEGRAVKRDKTLKEGAGLVVSVPAETVNKANDKKLVHVTGKPIVKDTLADPMFNISANAVRLVRKVETLQWHETAKSESRTKLGGGKETVTTYSYELKWSDRAIDSASFRQPQGHENRVKVPLKSKTFQAQNVKLGAFSLSQSQISRLGKTEQKPLRQQNIPTNLPAGVQADIVDGIMYIGSPGHNQAGDVRVLFEIAEPTIVSIVAQQTGNSFQPFRTSIGGTISLLASGNKPAGEMFQDAVAANNSLTWVLRVVGLGLLFVGFRLVLGVFAVFGSVIPLFGTIIGTAVSLISFLLAVCLGFIIIAIAWIFYRPLIGMALLAIGIAAGVFAIMRTRKQAAAPQPSSLQA